MDPIENFRKLDYLKLKPLYEIKIFSPFHASEFLKSSSSMAADCNGFSRYHLNKLSCGLSPILADFSSVVYKKGLPTGLSFPFYPISKDKQPPLIPQHNRFRPIGQVCNLIKGVVKNAFSQLDQHLSPIEDPNQFGFKSGNSVVSLVMTLLIDFFTCLKRCFVLRKYDISSAFTCLDFDIARNKLKLCNVKDEALKFFESYLSPRDKVFLKADGVTTEPWTESMGIVQGCSGGPSAFRNFTIDFRAKMELDDPQKWELLHADHITPWASTFKLDSYDLVLPPARLKKFADDSTHVANGSNWSEVIDNLEVESEFFQKLNDDNLMTLDPLKSETIPIIPPDCTVPDCPISEGAITLCGFIIDSRLTFAPMAKLIKSRLDNTFAVIRSLKGKRSLEDLKAQAKSLIYSDIYFAAVILALAPKQCIHDLDLAVHKIGRLVLKKDNFEHVSNFSIYKELKILPPSEIIAIATLLFWVRTVECELSNPRLKMFANRIFSTRRMSGFWPKSSLNRIHAAIFDAYQLYLEKCQLASKTPRKLYKLDKEELDHIFSCFPGPRKFQE